MNHSFYEITTFTGLETRILRTLRSTENSDESSLCSLIFIHKSSFRSNEVKTKLISVDSSIFEPSDISDVSSNEAVDSPPQEVPDVDEPNKKKAKI